MEISARPHHKRSFLHLRTVRAINRNHPSKNREGIQVLVQIQVLTRQMRQIERLKLETKLENSCFLAPQTISPIINCQLLKGTLPNLLTWSKMQNYDKKVFCRMTTYPLKELFSSKSRLRISEMEKQVVVVRHPKETEIPIPI